MPDRNKGLTGGRLVVDALRAHGVDHAFCVPGESYLEVLDALYDAANEISLVSCRHEHGAANMAEAYGKLTGRPGVCLVTRGPGACNASIGVHTAKQDSTPMVLLVGQVARPYLGRETSQEVDFERMYAPLAKWVKQIETADEVPAVMTRAFHEATSGRPGPVVVALPVDMLREAGKPAAVVPVAVERASPAAADMDRLRGMLGGAGRPIMVVGGSGWTAAARHGIVAFAEANCLPVCCAFRRHDIFDNTHPNFAGELGNHPDPALMRRVKDSDLVLAVGTRIGSSTSQGYTLIEAPRPAQALIHVYPGEDELGRVYEADLAIHADMPEFAAAAAAMPPVDGGASPDWVADARRDYEADRDPAPTDGALDAGAVMAELGERLTPDAVVTVDAGNFSGWPQRYLPFGAGQRFLGPTSGAMGYGVPAAVMAKIVAPRRMVVGCVGDGGFGMTGAELATAVMYGAAPIILVFNNRMYGTIRGHQERYHPDRVIGTDLVNPDYAAVAESHGAHGEVVQRTADFGPAFERAQASGKAAVIELQTAPEIITTRATIAAIRGAAVKGD